MAETTGVSNKSRSESAPHSRGLALRLFMLTCGALFLELMVIRWVPSTLRFVAYYANLMLISSFLGLGIGAIVAGRGWRLFNWFPALLALNVGAILLCRHVVMPGSANEVRFYLLDYPAFSYAALVLLFVLNTSMFVPLGERIGGLFQQLPTLQAYSWDLLGSLCGTLGFGLFSLKFFSPAVGFAAVMLIYLAMQTGLARLWSVVCFALVLAAVVLSGQRAATWSQYYYITVHADDAAGGPVSQPAPNIRTMIDPPIYNVSVNQDFYQQHGTIVLARYTPGLPRTKYVEEMLRSAYLLPYQLRPSPGRVLVVGAGGGIDVEAALLSGATHVDAVEIDRRMVELSRRFNASGVYDSAKVDIHIDDARAFFRRANRGYDLVVFGFLDSQALFNHSSNIRLDGYIYTVQSIRAAYLLLADDGLLALSFVTPQPWLAEKLHDMVLEATRQRPIVYSAGIQTIICAPRGRHNKPPHAIGRFALTSLRRSDIDVPTDDWPYLYLRFKTIPGDYLLVIGTLVAVSVIPILWLRSGGTARHDGHFFFLGMGFLLLETKSITDCSLYFGTTWFVTMIVLAGVLVMVLAANLVAGCIGRFSRALYLPLLISVLALYLVPPDQVLAWPLAARLAWALCAVPLPIFFAGLIFSTTLRDAHDCAAALGANLIGATAGGFSEYLGMSTGTRMLTLLVLAAYGASFLCQRPRGEKDSSSSDAATHNTAAGTRQHKSKNEVQALGFTPRRCPYDLLPDEVCLTICGPAAYNQPLASILSDSMPSH